MKTTRYFQNEVMAKRPYLKMEWIDAVIAAPLKMETQEDGRIRHWGLVAELGNKALRVVTLDDGETLHNAFPDRDFNKD